MFDIIEPEEILCISKVTPQNLKFWNVQTNISKSKGSLIIDVQFPEILNSKKVIFG